MIQIPGTLTIKTISGRHGDFNVAKLTTSIGEFSIKDAILDQYQAGRYEGNFVVEQIKPSYYSTAGGTLIVEIRAYLSSMCLDGYDDVVEPDESLVQDPVEEEAVIPSLPENPEAAVTVEQESEQSEQTPTLAPVDAAPQPELAPEELPFGMTPEELSEPASPDKALFGHVWPLGNQVRLDATIDRLQQRAQVARLRELGYQLDIKSQIWSL